MGPMDAAAAGQTLAERHASAPAPGPVDRSRSLINFAEITGLGDWSLRSALCRLAQPEPARVGRVLESVRRLENVLHHIQPALERHPALNSRPAAALQLPDSEDYVDVRMADVARDVTAHGFAVDSVVTAYSDNVSAPVTDEERMGLDLLMIAVRFERLAATLIAWADGGPNNPPVDEFDRACDEIEASLDALGVPRETGPPPRGPRGSRG